MDGILLESVEGLGHSPFAIDPAETWELLQSEKELLGNKLLALSAFRENNGCMLESEAAEEYALEASWQRRRQLETRLREVTDAQDRVIEGTYGLCLDCGVQIDYEQLAADLAAARCSACQRNVRNNYRYEYSSAAVWAH